MPGTPISPSVSPEATATENALDRRTFVAAVGSAAAASAFALPVARAAHAWGSDTIKIGLVGCGGRGSGAAGQALNADKGVVLHAMGDVFKDRLDSSHKALSESMGEAAKDRVVCGDRMFTGFDCYKSVIDSGVDAVLLTSYPNFRPSHAAYAIEKGKHVFAEKPVAVDPAGIRKFLAIGEEAKKKNLALMVGFCWRYHPALREAFAQVLGGTIGDVTSAYTNYLTGQLPKRKREEAWTDLEFQMRNWWHHTWISGDHIVEQAIHSIDRLAWAFGDRMPTQAHCLGGRMTRSGPEHGDSYDHFSAVYLYEGGLRGFHDCRQMPECPSDNTDYIYGTKGKAVINGWNPKSIKLTDYSGKTLWQYKGEGDDMYQVEHNELFRSIRAGKPINDLPRAAHSCMMGIMGRMAAYTGQTVTWADAMASPLDLQPAKLEFGPMPSPAVSIPGKK